MSRNLTDEEKRLVEVGIEAEHLISSRTFADAINALSEQLSNAILATKLPDTASRERLYMMHSCLNELVAILKSRVAAKDNIERMVNDDEADELKDNEE